jgi:uncharacterized protein YceK
MKVVRAALLAGCGFLMAGCGTIVGWTSPGYSKIYRGVQVDYTEYRAHAWWGPIPGYERVEAVGTTKQEWHAFFLPLIPTDSLFSFVADTGMLPFAIVVDLLRSGNREGSNGRRRQPPPDPSRDGLRD